MNAPQSERLQWIQRLQDTATPVFEALAADQLRERMPVDAHPQAIRPDQCTHLEAVGRAFNGLAPWLEGTSRDSEEATRQETMRTLVRTGLVNAVSPEARDCLNFSSGSQPLVDAAFLAQGLLRAWHSVWQQLPAETRTRYLDCFRATRKIPPCHNNWLLFSAMIEVFLLRCGEACRPEVIETAINHHQQWYVGDATYGDGPRFHWDYYNSFVIHPMLHDVLRFGLADIADARHRLTTIEEHVRRYAQIQIRMIAPDGSFPPIGRSLTYRCGAFHLLAHAALTGLLPTDTSAASVRTALSAVIERTLSPEATYDSEGWLQIGLCGHQPSLAEPYISTGSLYLCLSAFLPLGLAASDPFWSAPGADWATKQVWSGADCQADHALSE